MKTIKNLILGNQNWDLLWDIFSQNSFQLSFDLEYTISVVSERMPIVSAWLKSLNFIFNFIYDFRIFGFDVATNRQLLF